MADRTISVRIQAVVSQFQAGMAQAAASAKAFGNQMLTVGDAARKHQESVTLLGVAVAGAGAAILGGLGSAAKAAIDFEQSFSGVRKTVDASGPELDALAGQFRKLATEIPISVEELNKIGELGGALGIPKESLLDFTKTIALLGETTDLTVEDAAMTFGQLGNVLSLSGEEFDRLGSTIVDLGNKGASTEPQITALMLHMAGAAANIGLTADEVAGLAAALANVGIPAESGGSAISQIFAKLTREVATSGPLLEKFASVAQMSADDFATAFSDRPGDAITAFLDGLRQIAASGGNLTVVLDALGITEIRQVRAMQSLANASTSVKDTLQTSEEAFRTNTALSDEAAKKFETFASKLTLASNKVNDAKIEIGGFVTLAAEPFVTAIGNMAAKLGDMDGPLGAAVTGMAGLTGATLLVAGAALVMLPRIVAIKGAMDALAISAPAAATGLGLLGRAGLVGLGATAGLLATQGLDKVIDKAEEAGEAGKWYGRALEFTASRVLWALPIIRRLGGAAKESGDKTKGAGDKAAGAKGELEKLGIEADELADSLLGAAQAAVTVGFSFDNLRDNQLGVTAAEDVRGLKDSLEDAHSKLKDLKNEAPPVFDPEKWYPSTGKTSLEEMQKDREKFMREQREAEADFYGDQAREAAKSSDDRAREIARTERDISSLQDKLREAKRSALEVLRESTVENTGLLQGFVSDLEKLVASGNEPIARRFAEWGPTSATALGEVVDLLVNSPQGFAALKGEIAAAIDAEKRLADTHWEKWEPNFEEKGRKAGEAAGKGVEEGLARSFAELYKKEYTVELGVDVIVNPHYVSGDTLGQTRPYGSDPVAETTTDDLVGILNGSPSKRAAGGPVRAGWPYWVGEEGPEPFVPSMNGYVLSKQDAVNAVAGQRRMPQTIAPALSGSGGSSAAGDVVNVHIAAGAFVAQGVNDPKTFARQAVGYLDREMHARRRARSR